MEVFGISSPLIAYLIFHLSRQKATFSFISRWRIIINSFSSRAARFLVSSRWSTNEITHFMFVSLNFCVGSDCLQRFKDFMIRLSLAVRREAAFEW
jgi:hypothetical protein